MKKQTLATLIAALLLAVVAFLFFFPDAMEHRVLQQHDILQGLANGQEGKAFEEATGEQTRWTNSLFSGMPNFQIAPSYPADTMLGWILNVYTLWLPSPANLLFAMMLGFFIMCLCLKIRWYNALFGALAWGFSTYFIIIIGAGHIWKFLTLAFIPPTIGGIILCYRGKYLGGAALASLFGALQLQSNHPQMSYYFLFVIAAGIICMFIKQYKSKELAKWGIATACVVGAGLVAVAANSSNLYNSYEYSKETIRGKASDISAPGETVSKGLTNEYITAWSYGTDETFTLLIPNVKGGASVKPVAGHNELMSLTRAEAFNDVILGPQESQFLSQFPQYFGDQPMTNGPVYVGAFVLALALLALLVVRGPFIWGLFVVTILAILLSWGHNLEWFTNFFIENFPGYDKFRTVSSILVIVEFTLPLMAVLCLRKIINTPDFYVRYKWQFFSAFGVCILVSLAGFLVPGIFGMPFTAEETSFFSENNLWSNPGYSPILTAIKEIRLSLVREDSIRSLIFLLLSGGMIWLWIAKFRDGIAPAWIVCGLSLLLIIDLFSVNKRYVNSENFLDASSDEAVFVKTAADERILQDRSDYRVVDLRDFSGARSSYFHKTIGGYHAAKLTRYDDMLKYILNPTVKAMKEWVEQGNPIDSLLIDNQALNMLNAKYFMYGNQVVRNPYAQGNAWFVDNINYVDTPLEEISAIQDIDIAYDAVADKKFESVLGMAPAPGLYDTINLTSYAPNRLTYDYTSTQGGLAVFSEVYFPWGWKAEVDGKPVEIGRVNYILRAINLPAGTHELVMTFNPQSLRVTNTISTIAIILIYVLCVGSIVLIVKNIQDKRKERDAR